MTTKKLQKTPKKYECKECDFITSNKNDFNLSFFLNKSTYLSIAQTHLLNYHPQ